MTQEPDENQNNSVIIKELNTLFKPHLKKKTLLAELQLTSDISNKNYFKLTYSSREEKKNKYPQIQQIHLYQNLNIQTRQRQQEKIKVSFILTHKC